MEYKNYWGISENTQNDLVYTDSIYKIMDEQCSYLFRKRSIASTFCNQLSSAIIVSHYTQSKKFST